MKYWMFFVLFLTAGLVGAAEPDWSDYDTVLKKHVSMRTKNGVRLAYVDYGALKKDRAWASVVKSMEDFSPAKLSSRKEKLAYYINAYNILTLKVVADNHPVKSIKDVGNLVFPVWKKPAGRLGGRQFTLDQVEHEILRPMGEPRIHFAIVCASVSCPDLRREAYRASKLDGQLDDQARAFLANEKKGLRVDGKTVHLTKILDWFGEDFKKEGGVKAFVRKYKPGLSANYDYETDIPYDWALNGR